MAIWVLTCTQNEQSSDNNIPLYRSWLYHILNGTLTCVKFLLRRNSTQWKSNKAVSVEGLHTETFKWLQYAKLLGSCTMLVFIVWNNLDQNRNKCYAKLHRIEIFFRLQLAYVDLVWEHSFSWCTYTLEIRGFNLSPYIEKWRKEERKVCTIKSSGTKVCYHRLCLHHWQGNAKQSLHERISTRKHRQQSLAMTRSSSEVQNRF